MKKIIIASTMAALITGSAFAEVSNEVDTATGPTQDEKRNLAKELTNPMRNKN